MWASSIKVKEPNKAEVRSKQVGIDLHLSWGWGPLCDLRELGESSRELRTSERSCWIDKWEKERRQNRKVSGSQRSPDESLRIHPLRNPPPIDFWPHKKAKTIGLSCGDRIEPRQIESGIQRSERNELDETECSEKLTPSKERSRSVKSFWKPSIRITGSSSFGSEGGKGQRRIR